MAQKQKPKIGRPKLPKGEARSEMVRARVTPDEYKSIEAAAKADSKDVSEWARKLLLNGASINKRQP